MGRVIGDDGVEGITLGPGSPSGEAFADWQHYVKALAERGVILAVCSKNDPAVAETGFSHANAVLRRGDFAAFCCSWNDKAGGLRLIARALNVGIDSFVFCDDSPAECDLIARALPEVAVVCLGADPPRSSIDSMPVAGLMPAVTPRRTLAAPSPTPLGRPPRPGRRR